MRAMSMTGLALIAALAGCGGGKQADTTPSGAGGGASETSGGGGGGGGDAEMIPPEKMDEVTQDLKRKNMIVSRCLATAMENGEVKHGTRGRITFEINIGTDGHATVVFAHAPENDHAGTQ